MRSAILLFTCVFMFGYNLHSILFLFTLLFLLTPFYLFFRESNTIFEQALSPVFIHFFLYFFGVLFTAHVFCDSHLAKGEEGVAQDPFRPSVRRNIRFAISGLRSVRHFAATRREEC